MGFVGELAAHYGIEALIDMLRKKSPALLMFLDSLNEMTVFEAAGLYGEEVRKLPPPTETGSEVDVNLYLVRMTREPFIPVLLDMLKAYGLERIAGVPIKKLTDDLTQIDDEPEAQS